MNKIEVVEAKDLRDGRDFKVSVDRPFRDDEHRDSISQGWYRESKTIEEGTTVRQFLMSVLTDRYGTLTMGTRGEIKVVIFYPVTGTITREAEIIPLIKYHGVEGYTPALPVFDDLLEFDLYLKYELEPMLDAYGFKGLLNKPIVQAVWDGYSHTNGKCVIEVTGSDPCVKACEDLPDVFKEGNGEMLGHLWFSKIFRGL